MTSIPITRANGYLVAYAAAGQHSYELCDDLAEAKAAYQEPPRGWFAIGISPCVDGVPFASLDLVLTFGRKPVQIHRPLDVEAVKELLKRVSV